MEVNGEEQAHSRWEGWIMLVMIVAFRRRCSWLADAVDDRALRIRASLRVWLLWTNVAYT